MEKETNVEVLQNFRHAVTRFMACATNTLQKHTYLRESGLKTCVVTPLKTVSFNKKANTIYNDWLMQITMNLCGLCLIFTGIWQFVISSQIMFCYDSFCYVFVNM